MSIFKRGDLVISKDLTHKDIWIYLHELTQSYADDTFSILVSLDNKSSVNVRTGSLEIVSTVNNLHNRFGN